MQKTLTVIAIIGLTMFLVYSSLSATKAAHASVKNRPATIDAQVEAALR
ncbi:hypothetical protein V8Z74_14955 [Comamonas sp. w2-DMI]